MYVEYHGPDSPGLLFGEEYEVLEQLPAGAEYAPTTHPGNVWICPAYRLRDVYDDTQLVAPRSWFHRIADRPAGYNR